MSKIGYGIDQLNNLPGEPGVYKYYNDDGQLIYVGKAKNIKKRVSSYFNKQTGLNRKTIKLVSEIVAFDFAIVDNEYDALLLENNLIKENQPKYNILLKDDKTFPYICITNERFPRIISTRTLNKSWGEYYGPYSSVHAMNTILELIRKLYTIRTCKLKLSTKNIKDKKFKVCLEYHIGNCKGPCEGLQKEEDYLKDIKSVKDILKGRLIPVKEYYEEGMNNAAQNLEYELAQKFKEKLTLVENFQTKSTVVNPKLTDMLVFTYIDNENFTYINYMKVHQGAIIATRTVEIKKILDESPETLLSTAAINFIDEDLNSKTEIISNIEFNLAEFQTFVPIIGDKKKLIDLSLRNAYEYKKNKLLQKTTTPKSHIILHQLKDDLSLTALPEYIECFDNSNIQGTNPVSSMVCFKGGKPSKNDYRHYNIKTVEGPDDFASMYEVVGRRYKRLLEENEPLPQLIVIDGGKGQLSMATKAITELGIYGKVTIIGIAKRLEEIYFPHDKYPIHINKKSPSLRLLQHLRDEAHRFAITFHRLKRSNASLKSELESISGIGEHTIKKLLKTFKSVKKIKNAPFEEIVECVGKHKAELIIKQLQ